MFAPPFDVDYLQHQYLQHDSTIHDIFSRISDTAAEQFLEVQAAALLSSQHHHLTCSSTQRHKSQLRQHDNTTLTAHHTTRFLLFAIDIKHHSGANSLLLDICVSMNGSLVGT
jgi:hypothetical protein